MGRESLWGNPEQEDMVSQLVDYGFTEINQDRREMGAYTVKYHPGKVRTVTICILLEDQQTDADLVIKNIVTIPRGVGLGSEALSQLLDWAEDNNLDKIRATQVQKQSQGFWEKNGFIKEEGYSPTNDYIRADEQDEYED